MHAWFNYADSISKIVLVVAKIFAKVGYKWIFCYKIKATQLDHCVPNQSICSSNSKKDNYM